MPATRAADDFDTIRTRLEQIRKEQEEAQKNTPQQTNATEQDPGANYDYGCGLIDKNTILSELPIGLQKTLMYYDSLLCDEDDNIIGTLNGIVIGPINRVLP